MADADKPPGPITPETVFNEYAPRVFSLARRMLGNDADAEDVTQDVLLQVVRKLDTFRGEADIATWLYRVTVNMALAYRARRARRAEHEVHDHPPLNGFSEDGHHAAPVRPWSVAPDQHALDREQTRLIEDAIARLPDVYRDVYVLADVEGLPNAEIADLLGLNLPGVKSRLHRARVLMRNALAPHFEEVRA
jgi:RNA polymerase sigma-70 factor (ECF subfamily)